MRPRPRGSTALLLGLGLLPCLAAAVRAQDPAPAVDSSPALQVALLDGQVLDATTIEGDLQNGFTVRHAGQEVRVAAGQLLAVHGVAVSDSNLPCAWLAGGDVVRGALVGGDRSGDTLELQSPIFDRLPLRVDRLLALTSTGEPPPRVLPLPEGVDEALFRRARFGFDRIAGEVHEFGARGIRFLPAGESEPKWFALPDVVGLRIADPLPREAAAKTELWTRAGDRLGVVWARASGEQLTCTLEGGHKVELRWRDVACLCVRGQATFLSDLEPQTVSEAGFDGGVLYPWQRDRAVLGGPLVAGGRSYGKGLGVHSRSRLTFVVPDEVASFWTRVGLDDTAAALVARADVDVRVLVDGKVLFAHKGVTPGQAMLDTGLLAVRPGQELVLEVDFGKARELGDRVAWLLPVFLPSRSKKP